MQESAPLRDGHIVRVETLGGKYLYAIKVYPAVGSFDLCPADACQTTSGVELVGGACAVDAPKSGLRVEGYTPPAEIIAQVEAISRRAGLDIGGIEYLVDDRDGKHYFYDVNALSNFVADPVNVVGFDPWKQFVDYLEDFAKIYADYIRRKQERNLVDYDDLLLFWALMLEASPELAKKIGGMYDHVLVDEYQDTNTLQAEILRRLKPDGRGVTVVGDDAQAIYSFRAACVDIET